jgi:predicted ArsR family transcriptional regulator
MALRPLPDRVTALATLDDPVRRAAFDLVVRSGSAVGRDAAAQTLGVSRRVAAIHLDRLAEQGLLAVEYRRPPGRGGPGAGRPAKLYRRAEDEVAVSVPERHYDLAGGLLAAAVTESLDTGAGVRDVLHRTAYDAGRTIGAASGALITALEDTGYEPRVQHHDGFPGRSADQRLETGADAVVLGNCPFGRLARQHTELVCGMNLHLLRGVAHGAGDTSRQAELDPGPGRCCVRFLPAVG